LEALYQRKYKVQGKPFICGPTGVSAVMILLAGTFALVVAGATVNSFNFEFSGLVGAILGDAAIQDFSLLSLAHKMPYTTETPNSFGIRWIQVSFIFFAFIAPLCHFLVLMVLWIRPMTLYGQKMTFMLAEVCYAWSALDVFIISIIAALAEIKQFAEFVIGSKCTPIVGIVEKSAALMDYTHGNPACFDVDTNLESGCWLLFASCLVAHVVAQIIMRSAHRAIEERLNEASGISQKHVDSAQSSLRAACTSQLLSLAKLGATCGCTYLAEDSDEEDYDDDGDYSDGLRP
jgi:hypothetical protein